MKKFLKSEEGGSKAECAFGALLIAIVAIAVLGLSGKFACEYLQFLCSSQ